jgi:large subunit ribosomal protein L53
MISRFLTEVNTKFNPFSKQAKAARLFLTFLPPNARATGINIQTTLLPRQSTEPSMLHLKFSESPPLSRQITVGLRSRANRPMCAEDGKEMHIDCDKMGIKSIIEEVDRHSRILQKQADLTDS